MPRSLLAAGTVEAPATPVESRAADDVREHLHDRPSIPWRSWFVPPAGKCLPAREPDGYRQAQGADTVRRTLPSPEMLRRARPQVSPSATCQIIWAVVLPSEICICDTNPESVPAILLLEPCCFAQPH